MKTVAEVLKLLEDDRTASLIRDHLEAFGLPESAPCALFSSPGRVELAGNHTDHNGGTVLAAAVDLDILAAVSPVEGAAVRLRSDLYEGVYSADWASLEVRKDETGKPAALLRGVMAGFARRGFTGGALVISLSSRVLPGSGLSSSAAFEVLLARIFNDLFADGGLEETELALMGQEAENKFFGKPCGLMDQSACACGGMLLMDFRRPKPDLEALPFSFHDRGLSLFIVRTGSSHEGLDEHYTRVRLDMESAAGLLGARRLRDVTRDQVLDSAGMINRELGGRTFLRALHFFDEQDRLQRLRRAASAGDTAAVLEEMSDSGRSSCMYLGNCFVEGDRADRGILMGYYMTERYLKDRNIRGAVRVHGGGFAGTVLSCIPSSDAGQFPGFMEAFFGPGSVLPVRIRKDGAVRLL